MDVAISKLNRGGWVHIFPEGSRSRDGGKTMGSAKRGIGRLGLLAWALNFGRRNHLILMFFFQDITLN